MQNISEKKLAFNIHVLKVRHKLITTRALDGLIDLIKCHTPNVIHPSKYLLKQFKNDPPKKHFFCETILLLHYSKSKFNQFYKTILDNLEKNNNNYIPLFRFKKTYKKSSHKQQFIIK